METGKGLLNDIGKQYDSPERSRYNQWISVIMDSMSPTTEKAASLYLGGPKEPMAMVRERPPAVIVPGPCV